jgi:opacity protein-like surface antigen
MLMRTSLRISLALLIALALSTSASAQTTSGSAPTTHDRVSLSASVGPSFASLGTTFAATTSLEFNLTDRAAIVGEFGMLPRATFSDAAEIAPPLVGTDARRVNAYHWNGNLKVRPFDLGNASPYLTAGLGSFTADAVADTRTLAGVTVQDRRRASDLATNVGAGLLYRINDWLGVNADYRTFFVYRDADTPRVHRFTTGLALSLK